MQVLLLNRFFRSGQTVHVEQLARGLMQRGHKVKVYLDNNPESLKRSPQTLKAYNNHKKNLVLQGVNVLETFPEKVSFKTIIHAHSSITWPQATTLAKDFHCPLVLTIHGYGLNNYISYMQQADLVISVGKCFAEPYQNEVKDIIVLGNAVDLLEYQPAKKHQDKKVITYLGRYAESKRLGLIILGEALNEVAKKVPLEIRVIGNIPFGIFTGVNVNNYGWQEDRAHFLADSDIVIGTGMAIREGMATGNVGYVLGRDADGFVDPSKLEPIPEFTGGKSGLNPDLSLIYNSFLELLQDEAALRELQQESRLFAQKYLDYNNFLDQIEDLYSSLL